jgi:hypothetical protein
MPMVADEARTEGATKLQPNYLVTVVRVHNVEVWVDRETLAQTKRPMVSRTVDCEHPPRT